MLSHPHAAREPHLVTRIFRYLMWKVRAGLSRTITVDTRQGQLTVSTSDKVIGRHLFVCREFELDWIETALEFLRESGRLPARGTGTVLDIGANMGVVSIGMLCNSEFETAIAIEPDPENFKLLTHNARQNGLPSHRYICLPYAASDQEGEAEFELSQHNFGDHRIRADLEALQERDGITDHFGESSRRTIRVKVDLLDHLIEGLPTAVNEEVAVVWIDTQGHEGHVFAGGSKFFARDIPVVCEIWPYAIKRSGMDKEQFCSIVAQLWRHYWVWREEQGFVRCPTSEIASLWEELSDDLAGNHNIIFTK